MIWLASMPGAQGYSYIARVNSRLKACLTQVEHELFGSHSSKIYLAELQAQRRCCQQAAAITRHQACNCKLQCAACWQQRVLGMKLKHHYRHESHVQQAISVTVFWNCYRCTNASRYSAHAGSLGLANHRVS